MINQWFLDSIKFGRLDIGRWTWYNFDYPNYLMPWKLSELKDIAGNIKNLRDTLIGTLDNHD